VSFRRAWFVAAAPFLAACTEISSNKNELLSVQFDALASPSVVVGDSLRDTTGLLALPHVAAFNFQGDTIDLPTIRYHALDRGVTVDSVSGLIIGDSLRATAVRIIASVGLVQAQQLLALSLRPDTILAGTARDTIILTALDTTKNVSKLVGVKLVHRAATDSPVPSYIVSFQIVSPSNPAFADLINEGGTLSHVDTTDSGGLAGRQIRLHTGKLNLTATDSIVVNATAKYRGVKVKGSPVRLVVVFKPGS